MHIGRHATGSKMERVPSMAADTVGPSLADCIEWVPHYFSPLGLPCNGRNSLHIESRSDSTRRVIVANVSQTGVEQYRVIG
jgi:hypothetical protein